MTVLNKTRSPPVRTPDPLASSRRRAFRHLGSLRAMGLGAIGDIGSVSFGTVETLTWETATDWNNAVSESGIVHENVPNTDHTDDSIIKKGFQIDTPYLDADLLAYSPGHEDSGTTAYDFSSTANDGTYNGPSINNPGLLGTSTPSYDGTDDYTVFTDNAAYDTGDTFSVSFWFNNDFNAPDTTTRHLSSRDNGSNGWFISFFNGDGGRIRFGTNNGNIQTTKNTYPSGTWFHVVCVQNSSSSAEIWVDAVQEASGDNGFAGQSTSETLNIAERLGGTSGFYFGQVMDFRYYGDALNSSEINTLYDVVRGTSTLTTATKSFSGDRTPDLQNLDYTLNGESITVDVIGSPGTASEEIVSQTLDGSTSYALTWSNGHTDFRVRPNLSTSTDTVTPTISRIELSS